MPGIMPGLPKPTHPDITSNPNIARRTEKFLTAIVVRLAAERKNSRAYAPSRIGWWCSICTRIVRRSTYLELLARGTHLGQGYKAVPEDSLCLVLCDY